MPVFPPTQEEMARVLDGMRETIRARQAAQPDPINHDATLSLYEPIPLLWGGVEYRVRPISYREGLRLDRLLLRFRAMEKIEEQSESTLDAHERLVDEMLLLYASFLDPVPSINPFDDATPLEVGSLAGFFFTCRTLQNDPRRMRADRLSPSTT